MIEPAWPVPLDWGLGGLDRLAAHCDALILVDTLSFGTAVDVALAAGAAVYPCGGNREEALRMAAAINGVASGLRTEPGFSLSPASLQSIPAGTRLVLRAVNGGALAARAASLHAASLRTASFRTASLGTASPRVAPMVFVACLRNALAVATSLRRTARRPGIVAAGEKRRDGTTRYAQEDQLGAGALADALGSALSKRAGAAATAFRRRRPTIESALFATRSGRELVTRGFAEDVRIAARLDTSSLVPQLEGGMLHDRRRAEHDRGEPAAGPR